MSAVLPSTCFFLSRAALEKCVGPLDEVLNQVPEHDIVRRMHSMSGIPLIAQLPEARQESLVSSLKVRCNAVLL